MRLTETQKQALMGVVVFTILICGGIWYYMFSFGNASLEAMQKDSAKLDDDIKTLKITENKYHDWKSREKEIRAKEAVVRQAANRLPQDPGDSQFHQILANVMKETGVYPVKVLPLSRTVRQFYTEIPYQLECFSRYHDLGELFNLIEESPERFMRIRAFKITNQSDILKERPSVHYGLIEIAAYAFNPVEPKAPEAPVAEQAPSGVGAPKELPAALGLKNSKLKREELP
jgi:Tfp pilus assembly protein PilO